MGQAAINPHCPPSSTSVGDQEEEVKSSPYRALNAGLCGWPFIWSRADSCYLWEENSQYPFPVRPLLISFFPVLTITSNQLWQTSRQEGPQVWPHYLFLLPDDIGQLHLVNQSLLGDGEERREDTRCPYQSSLPSLSVWLGLEITRLPFGQGTTQKYILALLTFLSKSVFILRQHFSNSKVYKSSTWGSC